MNERIRKDIRKTMIELELSQAQLAQASDLAPTYLSDLLRGRRGNLPGSWSRLLDALGLELCVRPKPPEVI